MWPRTTTSLYKLTKEHDIELAALDSFVILICTKGNGTITDNNGDTITVRQGESILIPATTTALKVVPECDMELLSSWI